MEKAVLKALNDNDKLHKSKVISQETYERNDKIFKEVLNNIPKK